MHETLSRGCKQYKCSKDASSKNLSFVVFCVVIVVTKCTSLAHAIFSYFVLQSSKTLLVLTTKLTHLRSLLLREPDGVNCVVRRICLATTTNSAEAAQLWPPKMFAGVPLMAIYKKRFRRHTTSRDQMAFNTKYRNCRHDFGRIRPVAKF